MQHRYFISKYVMKQKLVALLKEAEKKLIRMTKTGNDFEKLSKFFSLHHVNLTPDSLKKLKNYFTGAEKTSRQTLDRLALFAGFQDWESLKKTFMEEGKHANRDV